MFIIYFKKQRYGSACTTLSGVAEVLELSRNTVVNWFRQGKTSYETKEFIVSKADLVKSKHIGNLGHKTLNLLDGYSIDNSIAD